jgi:hypothetical protein
MRLNILGITEYVVIMLVLIPMWLLVVLHIVLLYISIFKRRSTIQYILSGAVLE